MGQPSRFTVKTDPGGNKLPQYKTHTRLAALTDTLQCGMCLQEQTLKPAQYILPKHYQAGWTAKRLQHEALKGTEDSRQGSSAAGISTFEQPHYSAGLLAMSEIRLRYAIHGNPVASSLPLVGKGPLQPRSIRAEDLQHFHMCDAVILNGTICDGCTQILPSNFVYTPHWTHDFSHQISDLTTKSSSYYVIHSNDTCYASLTAKMDFRDHHTLAQAQAMGNVKIVTKCSMCDRITYLGQPWESTLIYTHGQHGLSKRPSVVQYTQVAPLTHSVHCGLCALGSALTRTQSILRSDYQAGWTTERAEYEHQKGTRQGAALPGLSGLQAEPTVNQTGGKQRKDKENHARLQPWSGLTDTQKGPQSQNASRHPYYRPDKQCRNTHPAGHALSGNESVEKDLDHILDTSLASGSH